MPPFSVVKVEPPLPPDLTDRLISFWEVIFETSYAGVRPLLAGAEEATNRDIIYLVQEQGQLAGTSHLTISRSNPELGGLGEVATAPAFRRRGIAGLLCGEALRDFQAAGGQAFFLGTVNPAAARVYVRLGWQKLAGANVWACITDGSAPDRFLGRYFEAGGPITITPGSPAERIPMIPLLLSPHPWRVLDANLGLYSTRYAVQNSCMGLYPRYAALVREGRGAWFAARTDDGRLVGLSTIRLLTEGEGQIDGFAHPDHLAGWQDLIQAAIQWGVDRGVSAYQTQVSTDDEDRLSRFEALGFHVAGNTHSLLTSPDAGEERTSPLVTGPSKRQRL